MEAGKICGAVLVYPPTALLIACHVPGRSGRCVGVEAGQRGSLKRRLLRSSEVLVVVYIVACRALSWQCWPPCAAAAAAGTSRQRCHPAGNLSTDTDFQVA